MTQPKGAWQSTRWYRSDAQQRAMFARLSSSQSSMDHAAWSISSRLIAGIGLYALIGWLISRWIGHETLLIAVGALLGLGLAYVLIFRDLGSVRQQDAVRTPGENSGESRAGGPA